MTSKSLVTAAIATLTAREYRRVSIDRSGNTRSVDEQGEDNARARERHGIAAAGVPYVDNDRSASRYARKKRDDFARLLEDLETGAFGANVLQLWESSRGSRKVGEWVTLIDLCEEHEVLIFVTTHDRLYDSSNEWDRKALLEDAVDSEYESGKVSKRTRRTAASEAVKGRPSGVPPHGYMRQYDPKTGKLITWVENLDESAVPKILFRGLQAGESLAAITRDLAATGHVNRSGRPFKRQHLRVMATRHAYAGLRAHQPGKTLAGKRVPAGPQQVTKGVWEPLLADTREEAEALFHDVQRIISAPSRKTSRNGAAKHDFTSALKCHECGSLVNVRTDPNDSTRLIYKCIAKSCVRVDKTEVDTVVKGTLLGYLTRPGRYELLAAPGSDDAKVKKIRAHLAEARANLAEMEAATPESLFEARTLARSVEALSGKITGLETQERELTMPASLAGILAPGTDVAQRWPNAPVSARREVARIILSPGLLGEVRVRRAVRVGNTYTAAADRIVWRRAAS